MENVHKKAFAIVCIKVYTFRYMTTKLVGIKEFQRNMSSILKEAQKKGIRIIVMRHTEPVGEFLPLSKKDTKNTRKEIELETLYKDIANAREEAKRGEVYSLEKVAGELGIDL